MRLNDRKHKLISPGFEPSLKDGLGFIPASRKPLAGTSPSGEDFIHIVPPVITIRTRDSGYCAAIVAMGLWYKLELNC
jgi:hypothetical protein